MNVLVTSARMPFALDEIRKLGQQGHTVYATDTFRTSPGGHSAFVAEYILTSSPRFNPERFIGELKEIMRTRAIDLLLPQFEEVFFIARHLDEFPNPERIFASSFDTLARFHDKGTFVALATELGIRAPRTVRVSSHDELRAVLPEFEHYIARGVYSRGGVQLYTNTGPLAGAVALVDCQPTADDPWLVQDFLTGTDVCSFSVAHHGKVAVHSAYVHPKTIENAGGIVFESIDGHDTLEIARKFIEATNYHGQISFDYMRTDDGLAMIECNPRPTDGVLMMPPEMFVEGLLDEARDEPAVLEPGRTKQIDVALVRDMIRNWKEIPEDIHRLLTGSDLYAEWHDIMPALYQFLSYSHVVSYRHQLPTGKHSRSDIMAAQFYDICWDGTPIP